MPWRRLAPFAGAVGLLHLAGFGLFDDRYNLSFLFITQPQRPVVIPGQTLPGIRQGADSATWVA